MPVEAGRLCTQHVCWCGRGTDPVCLTNAARGNFYKLRDCLDQLFTTEAVLALCKVQGLKVGQALQLLNAERLAVGTRKHVNLQSRDNHHKIASKQVHDSSRIDWLHFAGGVQRK